MLYFNLKLSPNFKDNTKKVHRITETSHHQGHGFETQGKMIKHFIGDETLPKLFKHFKLLQE